jgi:hypothetical protein
MKLKLGARGDATLLTVTEELGKEQVAVLRAGLNKLIAEGKKKIIVDLSAVTKISRESLAELMAIKGVEVVAPGEKEAAAEAKAKITALEDKLAELMACEAYTLRLRNRRLRFNVRLLARQIRENKRSVAKAAGNPPSAGKYARLERVAGELLKVKLKLE